MICHSVIIDVVSGTSEGVIEIVEDSYNVHQILINLKDGDNFYHIPENFYPEISFYDSMDNRLFTTSSVKILNYYRGQVSYIVGKRLSDNQGRYVANLSLYDELRDSQLNVKFIVNVSKNEGSDLDDTSTEVVIDKEFYKSLVSHLADKKIHLNDEDRDLLSFVSENKTTFITYDNLGKAISEDPEIRKLIEGIVNDSVESSLSEITQDISEIKSVLSWESL